MKREKTAFSITVLVMLGMAIGFALTKMSVMHPIDEMLKNMKIIFVVVMGLGAALYMFLRTIRLTLVNEEWEDGRRGAPSLRKMSWISIEVVACSGFWVCVINYLISHPEML